MKLTLNSDKTKNPTVKEYREIKMIIYKIRSLVTERKRGGKYIDVYQKEIIIIDNLQRAKEKYKYELNEVMTWTQYSKYHGLCELFTPHLFDNGELAYWPDNNIYINKYNKSE